MLLMRTSKRFEHQNLRQPNPRAKRLEQLHSKTEANNVEIRDSYICHYMSLNDLLVCVRFVSHSSVSDPHQGLQASDVLCLLHDI